VPNGIEATFLLGTYTGHRADQTADPLPDPARLHAALVNAATQGSTAVVDESGARPSEAAAAALDWLENNPPTGLLKPRTTPLSFSPIAAWRQDGVARKEGGAWKDKRTKRAFSDGYALDGPVGWCWKDGIPEGVGVTLEELCADVGCLGEATSPVRLVVTDVEPTHHLDADASMFATTGMELRVAVGGRTAALVAAHESANGKPPSVNQDKHTTSELPSPAPTSSIGLSLRRYRAVEAAAERAPWPAVVLLATSLNLRPDQRVRWCAALHRALIARIGYGAPPLITGAYPAGIRPPANRLAIQYLPAGMATQHGLESAAFALLIPASAAAEDLGALHGALRGLDGFSNRGQHAEVTETVGVTGEEFWPGPLPGNIRRWVTYPVAVPETVRQRRGSSADGSAQRWTLTDAVRVSVGLVWRDLIAGERTSSRWFEQIAAATREHGVEILDAQLLKDSDVASWVHKTPKQMLVQPYWAMLSLGSLATDRTLVAIGQSRHLGGGLLVPVDSPADDFAFHRVGRQ